MNFKCINKLRKVSEQHQFYLDILVEFNKCKITKSLQEMSDYEIVNQPLWGNKLFTNKNNCLFFKEWINSNMLYVKDLINERGIIKTEAELFNEVQSKNSIIQQLFLVKNCILKQIRQFDFSKTSIIDICSKVQPFFNGTVYDVCKQKKLNSNKIRCKMESIYSKEFNFENKRSTWKKIYTQRLKQMREIKLKEFNFKILQNIVPCGNTISKWKTNITKECTVCGTSETTKHMLFDCDRVNVIWNDVSKIVNTEIKWENIVVGMITSDCDNSSKSFVNVLISIVAYALFKENSHCKFGNLDFKKVNLKEAAQRNIMFYSYIFCQYDETLQNMFDKLLTNF